MATKKTSSDPSRTGPVAKGKRPRKPDLGPVAEQLGPRLRKELELVAQSEAAIMKGLADKEVSQQFLVDPAGALRRIGVELPPILSKRLKMRTALPDLMGPQAFRLPDGQVVTANVNVRFTARKEQ